MDCRTLTEIFAGERGDDLTEAESAACESHLDSCLACRERLAQAEDEVATLPAWDPEPPTAEAWGRVDRALQAELSGAPVIAFRPTRLPAMLVAAAAILLVVGAGILLQLQKPAARDGAVDATSALQTDVVAPTAGAEVEVLEVEAGPGFAAEAVSDDEGPARVVVTERE